MATKKRTTKKSAPAKDAIALLKQDHETVRGLLERATKSSGERRSQVLAKIEKEVKVHTQIEEEIFYPAFRDAVSKKDDRKVYFEAVEEHRVVDLVMPDVENGTDDEVAAHVKVLKELIEHHAGEEEKTMFPKARKVFDRDELRTLGEALKARKKALGGS
jgi:hemerythrin superfamily protein